MASLGFLLMASLLLLLMALSAADVAFCNTLKAKISCLDCGSSYDFSGHVIMVKCKKEKRATLITTTDANGSFKAILPSAIPTPTCIAKLIGAPHQLYASTKSMVSAIIRASSGNFFTLSTPLNFSTGIGPSPDNGFSESKTVNLPLPRQWGLPPSSYYVPIIPIGIP